MEVNTVDVGAPSPCRLLKAHTSFSEERNASVFRAEDEGFLLYCIYKSTRRYYLKTNIDIFNTVVSSRLM
jgi:hypothetical protein